jgi:hypothetical protein
MNLGLVRTGWSTCALLCFSWALVAWQSNGSRSEDATSGNRQVQRAREERLPWVTMEQAISRLRKPAPARPTTQKPASARLTSIETPGQPDDTSVTRIEFLTRASDDDGDNASSSNRYLDNEPDSPSASSESTQPLTPELATLRDKLRKALELSYPRHQNTRENSPWEVMHAIIAYGVDTQLFKNGPTGDKVNAVGWLCYNYPCNGEKMLFVNRGKIEARRGVGLQGHYGQFLAILAQSHVKSDYPMYVAGKEFTLNDLIEHEKENCTAGEELTFKLIALMHYLDSDATWKSKDGQDWSIQRLIQEELKQPIRGAACGGTHRLMGFSYAVNKRIQRGKPVVGQFQRAQRFIQDYHKYTFSLQNADGSFSTEWFVRKGETPDIDRRLKTSGHILEWIAFSVNDEELRDPRMVKAADYVASLLMKHDGHKWEIGPLGHGLHALAIYNARMFKDNQFTRPQDLVGLPTTPPTPLEARVPRDAR